MRDALDGTSPQLRPAMDRATGRGRKRRKPGSRGRLRVVLDPVRASRLRLMIERVVVGGLGLPGFGLPYRTIETLPLCQPIRGGAALAFARQVAMYLAHVGCAITLTEAGRIYGRDRTTAAHACAIVEERRDEPLFDRIIEVLERSVRLGLSQIEPAMAAGLKAR